MCASQAPCSSPCKVLHQSRQIQETSQLNKEQEKKLNMRDAFKSRNACTETGRCVQEGTGISGNVEGYISECVMN